MVWLSNAGAVVALVGGVYLAIQMIHRLRTREVVRPLPSLAELAESARAASDSGAPPRAIVGEGAAPDSLLAVARLALGRGRWHEARRAFEAARAHPAVAGNAALGSSLLAAWQYDEAAARSALAAAVADSGQLTPAERRLLDAHRRWMTGDLRGSDTSYRRLLAEVGNDPTLWYGAAFVHRHDGGALDSLLVGAGSPAARRMREPPNRRVSTGGAGPALWHVLHLAPYHEAARLELARMASLYGDEKLVDWLAWGAELGGVEGSTRLAMRLLAADAATDTGAWGVALRLAEDSAAPGERFAAARALATSAGVLQPRALRHAGEVLLPLTRGDGGGREVAALAHAWRGQLLAARRLGVEAQEEIARATALDSSLGLPLAAWVAWSLRQGSSVEASTIAAALDRWSAQRSAPPTGREWLHPHAGLEPELREYALGLLALAARDTTQALSRAAALDRLSTADADRASPPSSAATTWAAAIRGDVAAARADFPAAVAATEATRINIAPLARDQSPFAAQAHARFRRAYVLQWAWRTREARAGYATFFSPSLPELVLYRLARAQFDETP